MREDYPSLRLYDKLGVPYVVHENDWNGPLWTGHCMMLDTHDGYGDDGFLHELFHWIEASPRQRNYPDFALGRQINATKQKFATSTSRHDTLSADAPFVNGPGSPKGRNLGWGERTVVWSTAVKQETNACAAMFFYFPLVGLENWSCPHPSMPTAADEFYGDSTLPSPTMAKQAFRSVNMIDPTITLDRMIGFLDRMRTYD